MTLLEVQWLHALWAAPALAALLVVAHLRSRAQLGALIEAKLWAAVARRRSPGRRALKGAAALGALALVATALARPAWDPKPRETRAAGRDVVFVVDVSRSMLAEDLKPSRLERAKIAIKEALDALRGDRAALVAFAGTAVLKCPLTFDYSFVRLAVDDLAPTSVPRGGTNIGDAVRLALDEAFDESSEGFKDIVLITDGEDHESLPVAAAERAGEMGARIIAIGLGDEEEGQPIPITDPETGVTRFVTYEGERVMTKLDAETLRAMAAASRGGVYFNVATGNINLDEIYAQLIRDGEKRELEGRAGLRYTEGFQWLLAPALALLALEAFVRETRRDRHDRA